MTPAFEGFAERCSSIIDQVERAVVGKRSAIELMLAALLADGHVIIEDLPGLAKTLLAKSLAAASGLELSRVQFTPDLMPSDITGSSVFDQRSGSFEFRPGPIFTNILLGDEINRAPPKTQAALLEAMQERQVTADGVTHVLARPFLVLATQNPIEYEGTYPLPEAQLDRFLLRVSVGYPAHDDEIEILSRRIRRGTDDIPIEGVVDAASLVALQKEIEGVHVAPSVVDYMVRIVEATRTSPALQTGSSPRGSLALLKCSRATAAMNGRCHVLPDDVKIVATAALAHRLILRPEYWAQGFTTEAIVDEILHTVPTPSAGELLPER